MTRFQRQPMMAWALMFIGVLGFSTARSVEFAGGTGEPNDPYQIATAEQLLAVDHDPNVWQKHYMLVATIDLSGVELSGPVIECVFNSFEGNGYTIENLGTESHPSQGLFKSISQGGIVQNLGIVNAYVEREAGGVLASSNWGTVRNCYVRDAVIHVEAMGGGLIGTNLQTATMSNCYSVAEVSGGMVLGGLVGQNAGVLFECYSGGTVMGDCSLGGLVANNSGALFSCYSDATVVGTWPHMGGLAGFSFNEVGIAASYFLDPWDGGGPDNGFGTALTSGQMMQQTSFAGWDFWGSGDDGPADLWFMPDNGYPVFAWQTDVTGLRRIPDVAGLSVEEGQAALTAAGFVPGQTQYDYDSATPAGRVIQTKPYGQASAGATVRLIVRSEGAYDWANNVGDGTAEHPYEIATAGQLEALAADPNLWDKHFVLAGDVDLTGRTYERALIAPDTGDFTGGFQGARFSGTFDGRGHAIHGLTITRTTPMAHYYVGLFGVIAQSGRISNLRVLNADVEGRGSAVGVLAGSNAGTIDNCSATGVLRLEGGNKNNDGLIGVNTGTATNCTTVIART